MLFKGTSARSSSRISEESDELGGTLNAYTAEECTCVYIKVLAAWVKHAFDLVDDIVSDPIFDDAAIENEKKVIIEEIASADDNPEDAAQEMLMSNMFAASSIGMPVLGRLETVNSFNKKLLREFYEAHYTPDNMVLSIAGNFDENEIKAVIEESRLAKKPASKQNVPKIPTPVEMFGGKYLGNRDIGQIQLVAGYPCVARHDPLLYAFVVLSGILGGDSSSRFFRRLREENGLVYNVDATAMEYECTGVFVVNTSFSGENTELVCKMLREEICDVLKNGVTQEELERT